MYYNDVHIGYYLFAAIIGLVVGQVVDWANTRLPEYKKVFSLDIFKEYKRKFKPNYILMLLVSSIYVTLIYIIGIKETLIANLDLIKYIILTPMLLSVFVIDYRLQIIPNRLNLTIFECGLIFAFLYRNVRCSNNVKYAIRNDSWCRNISHNYISWRIVLWKRGNGLWRCKTNGSTRTIFWII